jgi:hypothetical protein
MNHAAIFDNLSKEEYIFVLETEMQLLLQNYYKPESEGTGHFNTAASVLKCRIEELRKET